MRKETVNKSASILAKLQDIARAQNIDSNLILMRYCQERFLYRLSISKFSNNFCLKGGLLLISLGMPSTRPTKDIDFLAKEVSKNTKDVENIVSEISSLHSDDSVEFITKSIVSEEIIEGSNYEGIRIKMPALIGRVSVVLRLDFAWGDVVKPSEVVIDFPTLLSDELQPKLNAYSIESVVSEKFEASVSIGITNSRMKDFYDLYILSRDHNFKAKQLREAIIATFNNRETSFSSDLIIFQEDFSQDHARQRLWVAFLQKHKLANIPQDFGEIIARISALLEPVTLSIVNNNDMESSWNSNKGIWE